jgi:CRISPR-associated endonuclease/helicase Cas3
VLWAKLDSKPNSYPNYHLLICHLIDTASVALALWDSALSPAKKIWLASALGLSGQEDAARRWIAFIAGLHDIGKASPAFQLQDDTTRQFWEEQFRRLGLHWTTSVPHRRHGDIGAAILPDLLQPLLGNRPLAARLATILGGHHGVFPSNRAVLEVSREAKGGPSWANARAQLTYSLADLLRVPLDAKPTQLDTADAMTLAGLVSVADWIASDKQRFPYCQQIAFRSLAEYFGHSVSLAEKAVEDLHWTVWKPLDTPLDFRTLFLYEPNDLQAQAIHVTDSLLGPSLVIVEAPMGEGKTEAAMYLARHWEHVNAVQGCYFALPTQATSNQMFSRVHNYLTKTYPKNDAINLQLLHGHAALSKEFESLKEGNRHLLNPNYNDGHSHEEVNVLAAEWFTYRKRGLLSPFGVGTIDQALLSILQTKHMFVRLFGLSSKTVIMDEVHAYDTYMTTLLERLLEWLAALGSPVVMLSATLPRERRGRLLQAYAKGLGKAASFPQETTPYPRITWLAGNQAQERHVETSPRSTKHMQLEWIDGSLQSPMGNTFPLGERLSQALANGGCAAVICNTVHRAQAVYRALKHYFSGIASDGAPELDLLHSQYLFEHRDEREKRTLQRFGKPTRKDNGQGDATAPIHRPKRAVLVATQVIEQSLDLDFDLMVSDMAPLDLLLQRAGRLHRHERPQRPFGLESPRLLVCKPTVKDGVPQFEGGDAAVYDPHVLLRSWLALQGRTSIDVPADVEPLIEAVYGDGLKGKDQTPALQAGWAKTERDMEAKRQRHEAIARQLIVLPPDYPDDIFEDFNRELDEDNPEIHESLRAQTRLSDPTVEVVILSYQEARNVDMKSTPDLETAKVLLHQSARVSHQGLVWWLIRNLQTPSAWHRSALLRHHRLIILEDDGKAKCGSYILQLHPELGLQISSNQ